MKWKASLAQWREERGLTTPQITIATNGKPAIINMLQEELNELTSALVINDENEIIDALADLIVLSANHIGQMGYDLDLVMKETLKEISSRVGSINTVTGKWEKDKSPSAQANWYTADYSTCKVKRS